MTKTCYTCKSEKPVSEFQKRSSSKDGFAGTCKECKRSYDNSHYKANPSRRTYIKENSKKRIQEVKAWMWEYLNNHVCVDCGESDPIVLEFDHREDKEANLGAVINVWGLPRIKREVAKCDVRCANCHRRKTAAQFGWWKSSYTPL